MRKRLCKKARCGDLALLALAVEMANGYVHGSVGVKPLIGEGETAFFGVLMTRKCDYLGVDKLDKLLRILGGLALVFDYGDLAKHAYLRGGKSRTACGGKSFAHVVKKSDYSRIYLLNLAAFFI